MLSVEESCQAQVHRCLFLFCSLSVGYKQAGVLTVCSSFLPWLTSAQKRSRRTPGSKYTTTIVHIWLGSSAVGVKQLLTAALCVCAGWQSHNAFLIIIQQYINSATQNNSFKCNVCQLRPNPALSTSLITQYFYVIIYHRFWSSGSQKYHISYKNGP